MVKEVQKKGKKYYECCTCNFVYKDRKHASDCEKFCNKNKSCNIEIAKHAVK